MNTARLPVRFWARAVSCPRWFMSATHYHNCNSSYRCELFARVVQPRAVLQDYTVVVHRNRCSFGRAIDRHLHKYSTYGTSVVLLPTSALDLPRFVHQHVRVVSAYIESLGLGRCALLGRRRAGLLPLVDGWIGVVLVPSPSFDSNGMSICVFSCSF